jgi:hypothetical protein
MEDNVNPLKQGASLLPVMALNITWHTVGMTLLVVWDSISLCNVDDERVIHRH